MSPDRKEAPEKPELDRLEAWKSAARDVVIAALESTLSHSWATRDALVFSAACEALERIDSTPEK